MKKDNIKQIVKKHYAEIAHQKETGCCNTGCGCGGNTTNNHIAKSIGYSEQEIGDLSEVNLGLGCGNPTGMGNINDGDVVLDLGSGAGFDCFLAAKKVGARGRVIGVDMTQEMIDKARLNAEKLHYDNVEFRLGDIEELPVESCSVDVVISNCVINLAPDKSKVFKEAFRVLKKGGTMYNSDIVLLQNLSAEQKKNEALIAGCVGGALLKDAYVNIMTDAGFTVTILSEDTNISKRQYQGIPLESLKVKATK